MTDPTSTLTRGGGHGFVRFFRREHWPFIILTLLPSLLMLGPLRRGAIPYFMDTLMYFYPLRVAAARLLAQGEWPLWNRSIMAGVPLFENPQSALAYPLHWPGLLWPGGFWFTFPLTLQLGLYAALTAWALRRVLRGGSMWPAFWAGALALAGNYGWSRLQFGNYLNVLPWWPLWLGTAHAYAQTRRPGWLAGGTLAVTLALLAGAHQLAVYGLLSFFVYGLMMIFLNHGARALWVRYTLLTFSLGVLIAAPGWLPQIGFIRETSRAAGLDAGQVLGGSISSWRELMQSLVGPWEIFKIAPLSRLAAQQAESVDAESAAAIGLAALALAGVIPGRRRWRQVWLAGWAVIFCSVFFSLRAVVEPLLRVAPLSGLFHDPRRWLGVTQWFLILNAAIGLTSLASRRLPRGREPWRLAPALALMAIAAAAQWGPGSQPIAHQLTVCSIALTAIIFFSFYLNALRRMAGPGLFLVFSLLMTGWITWTTTDLKMLPAGWLQPRAESTLIMQAGLHPGERFFTLDHERAASYDYTRDDLKDWALPNLAMLWGLEDLGGYEPAQSNRYRAFIKSIHVAEPWRQPYAQHFGLIQNPLATAPLAEANVRAALMPRWGVPLFFQPSGRGLWQTGFPVSFHEPFSVRALLVGPDPAVQPAPGTVKVAVREADGRLTEMALDAPHRLSPGDDMIITPGAAAAPGGGRLSVSTGTVAPRVGPPMPWLAAVDGPSRLVAAFAWNAELARIWQPVAVHSVAALLRPVGADFKPSWTAWPEAQGRVFSTKIQANRLELNVEGPAPAGASLEIHDAWWPGWRAWIDGEPVSVEPAGLWRLIDIPSGRHTVVLAYRPRWLMPSLIIAGAGFLLLVATLRAGRRPTSPRS